MTLLQSINLDIANKLRNDKEYRDVFFEDWAKDEVAAQIRTLRKLRHVRQVDVANETGMKQSAISRIEQSEYSRWNFVTLLRIAQALDARVRVVFEPAEDVIKQYESDHKDAVRGVSALDRAKAERERAGYQPGKLHNLEFVGNRQGHGDHIPGRPSVSRRKRQGALTR